MRRLSRWLYRVSKGWLTLAAIIFFFVFTPLVLPQQAARFEAAAGPGPSPDQSFLYSTAELYQMADSFGPDGRAAYVRARWTFDVIWPLVYTVFLATAISWLARRSLAEQSPWRLLNMVPVIGMVLDYAENICTSVVVGRYPAQTPVLDVLATVFTPLKWVFVGGSFVVLAAVGVAAVVQWRRGARQRTAQRID